MLRLLLAFVVIFWLLPHSILAQACCSGGVPVSSNLGLPASAANTFQVNLSYDLNALNTLKTGTKTERSQERKRETQSILLELGYSFSKRFSIDAFFAFVQQERFILLSNGLTATRGLGDAFLLFKYNLFQNQDASTSLTLGLGPKFPLGATDFFPKDALVIPNLDLQAGSGAWDALFWGQFTQTMPARPSMNLVVTSIYSYRGVFDEYLCISEDCNTYQFGRDFQLMLGISDRINLGTKLLDPSLSLRYRQVTQDLFNASPRPSTGGSFVFVAPSLTFWLNPNASLSTNLELPIYAKVRDTQVSPTYRLTLGFYHKFQLGRGGKI